MGTFDFFIRKIAFEGVFLCKDKPLRVSKKLQGYTCYVCKKFSALGAAWMILGCALNALIEAMFFTSCRGKTTEREVLLT